MDLKTFISESLEQIVAGIKDAQSKTDGDNIAAEMFAAPSNGHLINGGTSGMFTAVDFDVAVTASTSGGGKAQISVFGNEVGGGGEHKIGRESRIKFAVQVKLPMGAKAKKVSGFD